MRSFVMIDDRKRFCEEMQQKIGVDETFLDFVFSDEAKFHLDVIANMHNCRIWSSQPAQEIIEYQMDRAKVATVTEVNFVNTWCDSNIVSKCRPTDDAQTETY
jgi:hypothetical protein